MKKVRIQDLTPSVLTQGGDGIDARGAQRGRCERERAPEQIPREHTGDDRRREAERQRARRDDRPPWHLRETAQREPAVSKVFMNVCVR